MISPLRLVLSGQAAVLLYQSQGIELQSTARGAIVRPPKCRQAKQQRPNPKS